MATIIESFIGDYLLNKLVTFAEEKVVVILRVKSKLAKLGERLRHVRAYLSDAEKRRINEDSIKIWLNKLKDLVYDADDMIDLWRYKNQRLPVDESESPSNSTTCCNFSPFSCFRTIAARHELAEQVQTLNSRLDDILKDMSSLNLRYIQSNIQEVRRINAPITSPIISVDVVGKETEEAAKKLVKLANLEGNKKINIVAITGMGGIGKTTLAKKIYNNQTIQNRYTIQMWLSITQIYSPAQLIKEAIRFAGHDPGQAEREPELLPILARAISGKSLFLVLDDVWCPDLWLDLLQDTIRTNATQGFILVTTRDQTVAMQMGAQHIHQASILSAKSGWELLCKRAYLNDIQDIKNLEEIGTKIVEKCGGLPIAIKAIAGMLAKKDKNKNEWQNVLASSVWSINGLPKDIDQALYLSYEDLSPQLRQCFLYCSLYPPNEIMYREDLVCFWIAEGFVEEKSDQIMEITAKGYYKELITRHLLEPDLEQSVDYSQCKMHDLLRSLAQYLSRGETFTGDNELPYPIDTSIRRLSIAETNKRALVDGQAIEQLRLRTFIIFNCQHQMENNIFLRFKYLRVLYINEKGLNCIPESIGDLIHLRLLDLNRTSISTLPESIGSLTNLLILCLADCELLQTLPRGITRLYNLRYINLDGTPLTSVPKGLARLQKLTEIWGFLVGDDGHDDGKHNGWDLQELEGLSQLRRISIYKLERARNISVVLANKTHLERLHLEFSEVDESNGHIENENGREILEKLCTPPSIKEFHISNYRGKMLPRWMSSSLEDLLPNLQYLVLTGWLCCPVLPPLRLLPNLKYLRVQDASAIVRIDSEFLGIREWKGPNSPIAFPKLEYLIFETIPNWEEWTLSVFEGEISLSWHLMPHMKEFGFYACPKLRAIPKGLQQLNAVEALCVYKAGSIRSIQDFSFVCEKLELLHNPCLELLSNLPGVKRISIDSNPNLRHVSKLDSLEQLELTDYRMESLPEWLIELMEERRGQNKDELHLDLFCSTALLERCLKDGPDWPVIKCFSSVTVHNRERTAYMEYTREPESYLESF